MSNSDNRKAYNIITTAAGYINRVRMVKPESGDPYMALDFKAMAGVAVDGDYSKVKTIRYSLRVVGKSAIDILKVTFGEPDGSISQDDKVAVFAALTFSDPAQIPNEFDYTDSKTGEKCKGYSTRARLLKIDYMKVGQDVVVSSSNTTQDSSSKQGVDNVHNDASNPESLPVIVNLSPEDTDFAERKARLKEAGYVWSSGDSAWVLPTPEPATA